MGEVRTRRNRFSGTLFQSVTQLENVLQELNGAIHKKRTPKNGLLSKFKRPKLDDYRRSIIERALQGQPQANHCTKKKTSQFMLTSTPIPKRFNNKSDHVVDDRNSSLVISPITKTSSISSSSSSSYDNIISEDTSKSSSRNYLEESSQNLTKSNRNSNRSILNRILALQLHDEQSINSNESTSNSNESMKLRNDEHLNKSVNNSKINNNTNTCNNDELSTSVRADVEQFLKDLDSMMNERGSIIKKKPWRIDKSFALEGNSSLVEDLDEKCHANKKRFVNKKSLVAVNKNTQESSVDCSEPNHRQVAIFEGFIDKPDDNGLDKSDSDLSDSDLKSMVAFLSSIVKPTVDVSARFCDDDDDDDDGDGRTTKKVLSSYGKKKDEDQPSTSKASTLKQNRFQTFDVLQIGTGLEHNDDSQDEIVYENRTKRCKTTKQTSRNVKKTTRNKNNNRNNVNKRSCSLTPETSWSNNNQTQATYEGIRRSSRARQQVQFKGTIVMTDSVKVYRNINDTTT